MTPTESRTVSSSTSPTSPSSAAVEAPEAPVPPALGSRSWRDDCLEVAVAVADRLCAAARWPRQGQGERCAWPSTGGAADDGAQPTDDGFLYGGSAGVALFLGRLGEQVGDPSYRRSAAAGLRHALAEEQARPCRAGYYSGTAGLAAAGTELAQLTGEARWLEVALDLCRRLGRVLDADPDAIGGLDVIAGEAGSILGLLQVYAFAPRPWILETAVRLGDRLIAERRVEPEGLSWETLHPCVSRNLLGLSHGAGGIGLAFLELYHHTREARHLEHARAALRYEDHAFHPRLGTWPDFRHLELAAYVEEGRLQELRRDLAEDRMRPEPGPPRASHTWCHGAPGIGLVRGRFHELLGGDHLEAVRTAAELVFLSLGGDHATDARRRPGLPSGIANHCLCHGACGNAEALDVLRRYLAGEPAAERFRRAVRRQAESGIEEVQRAGGSWTCGTERGVPAPGLMAGEAGIGLFYLRLAQGASTGASMLLPVVPPDPGQACIEPAGEAAPLPYRLCFERTRAALGPTSEPQGGSIGAYRDALQRRIARLDGTAARKAWHALSLDDALLRLGRSRPSPAERYLRGLMRRPPQVLAQPEVSLQLAATTRFFESRGDQPAHLLFLEGSSYTARPLSPLAALLFRRLQRP
ncbi:MAG: hypothetical protein MI919_29550, partial [Holophagales bacterium]|nr:hypothetical protein [Holophagales bacterium]